jgi:hypothetical protein
MANKQEDDLSPYMRRLLAKLDAESTFKVTYRMFQGPEGSEEPDSILSFLGLESSEISPLANRAIEELDASSNAEWVEFKWKLTAFTYLQDIFDAVVHKDPPNGDELLFHHYYFYYESLHLLRESLLCGLNGFTTSSCALLRPFLEFSLLQLYFYQNLRAKQSFSELERFFTQGITPKQSTLVKHAVPNDEFCRVIRFRVQNHLSGLAESTLHAYHPLHSPIQHNASLSEHSFESLHFWYTTRLALDAALWLYFVNFPMLFFPVDVLRKFGANGPVGLYADRDAGVAVKRSMDERTYASFVGYAEAQPRVVSLRAAYGRLPDLSDAEIEALWNEELEGEPFPGVINAYGQTMARTRGTKAALSRSRMPQPKYTSEVLERARSLDGWRQLSRTSRAGSIVE